MSKALSLDLRVRVLAGVAAGMSHRAAGERFGVSAASVSRWRTGLIASAAAVPTVVEIRADPLVATTGALKDNDKVVPAVG